MVLKPNDDTKAAGVVKAAIPWATAKMDAVEFKSSDPWEVLASYRRYEKNIGKRVECIPLMKANSLKASSPSRATFLTRATTFLSPA